MGTIEETLEKIEEKCKVKNIKFNGFATDNYTNAKKLKLKLECLECGYKWETTSYEQFIRFNIGCVKCHFNKMQKDRKLDENKALLTIKSICKEKNYEFLGFVGGKYVNAKKTKLILKCNKCGNIWDTTSYCNFRAGNGCPECKTKPLEEEYVIKQINKACSERNLEFLGFVGEKYVNNETMLSLKCKKCGNIWNSTRYRHFIYDKCKCSNCRKSLIEMNVEKMLKENNFDFKYEKRFDWLEKQTLDFYIPSKNVAIECQGLQHFMAISFGHKNEVEKIAKKYERQIELDKTKKQLCEEHGIKLIYYSNLGINYPYKVYENLDDILKILNGEDL